MASEFAKMFLDRKRIEQGRSNGLETSPAPSPYQRYGVSVEIPLRSGKFTGNGEDGILDPTMPTERRVAINGRPYAVDEGEVVVINAETVKAYGGPENLDRYIQSHRPDSNYQEMGPREEAPQDPRITRGAGQAPASMMNQQFSTGGVPSRPIRPYDSQYEILKDIQVGMPRMFLGGPSTKVTTKTTPIPVTPKIPNVVPTVQPIPEIVKPEQNLNTSGLPGTATGSSFRGLLGSFGENILNYIDTGRNKDNSSPWPFIPTAPAPLPTTTEQYQGPEMAPLRLPTSPAPLPTTAEQYQGPEMALHRPINPDLYRTTSTALKGGIKDAPPAIPPPVANPPAGQPVLSPSKLDEMILDSYLTRMGGMSESERAAEEQRLMQQGVSPEAIRGQVAMSDVSRRSAIGQAAEQFATGAAQREQTLNQQNRTFEETRRANMPNQMKTDAGTMSEASWIAKYPNATHDDYLVASGQNVTPAARYELWRQEMDNLRNRPGVTLQELETQWAIGANDPTFAPFMSTYAKPNFAENVTSQNQNIDTLTDALINFGIGKTNEQGIGYSDSATYRNDMRDFVEAVVGSGGTVDPRTGAFTFGTNADGSFKTVDYPWNDPDKWMNYTDFDGTDIPGTQNPNDPAWLAGTVKINGKDVVRSDLMAWWEDLDFAKKILIASGEKTVGDYYGKVPGGNTLPTERTNLDEWFSNNPEAQDAYDEFRDNLGAEGYISMVGEDGNEYRVTGGDYNLRWIWTQLVNDNGGDYSVPISQDTISKYEIDKSGNITKKKSLTVDDIGAGTSLQGVNDAGQWRIKSGTNEVLGGKTIRVTNPNINDGKPTLLLALGNSVITRRGINNMRYRFYDAANDRYYYVDTSGAGSEIHEQTDPQTITEWKRTYSDILNNA